MFIVLIINRRAALKIGVLLKLKMYVFHWKHHIHKVNTTNTRINSLVQLNTHNLKIVNAFLFEILCFKPFRFCPLVTMLYNMSTFFKHYRRTKKYIWLKIIEKKKQKQTTHVKLNIKYSYAIACIYKQLCSNLF